MTVITVVFFSKKPTPSANGGIFEVDFQARDIYDGKVIEKVFGNRKHRLIFVFINDYVYSSDECAEWMQAFGDTMDREASPDSYKNPLIEKMFDRIKEDHLTPDERAKMKEEDNQQEAQMDALNEGMEKGLEEAARKLLVAGSMSAEQIANVTGLPLEKVKALSVS